eukprot:31155-Pelagococcus_subviridis.AAC.1
MHPSPVVTPPSPPSPRSPRESRNASGALEEVRERVRLRGVLRARRDEPVAVVLFTVAAVRRRRHELPLRRRRARGIRQRRYVRRPPLDVRARDRAIGRRRRRRRRERRPEPRSGPGRSAGA